MTRTAVDSRPLTRHALRPARLLGAVLVLASAVSGCGGGAGNGAEQPHPETALYQALEAQRLPLIEGLHSYDSEAQVTQQLSGSTVERRLLRKPASGRYPPRDLLQLSVKAFRHWGEPGELRLELFNDRLMEVEFRPKNAVAYARMLHKNLPSLPRSTTGTTEWVKGHLRLYSNVYFAKSNAGSTLDTQALVLWQDRRLTRQRDDWDLRFGSIPVSAAR